MFFPFVWEWCEVHYWQISPYAQTLHNNLAKFSWQGFF